MPSYPDETAFARRELTSQTYRERVESLEEDLHELSQELKETKIDVLKDQGYNSLTIDDVTLLVPRGMNFEQLYNSLQQMPPPEDRPEDYALTYFVQSEDRKAVSQSDKYQQIVEQRRDILERITDTYTEFWNDEVEPVSETTEESIVYMMAGLDREIAPNTLSDVMGVEERQCRSYSFNDDDIVVGP